MNTMKMPGFTAEVSLYKTGGHYRAIVSTFNAIVDGRGAVASARERVTARRRAARRDPERGTGRERD